MRRKQSTYVKYWRVRDELLIVACCLCSVQSVQGFFSTVLTTLLTNNVIILRNFLLHQKGLITYLHQKEVIQKNWYIDHGFLGDEVQVLNNHQKCKFGNNNLHLKKFFFLFLK